MDYYFSTAISFSTAAVTGPSPRPRLFQDEFKMARRTCGGHAAIVVYVSLPRCRHLVLGNVTVTALVYKRPNTNIMSGPSADSCCKGKKDGDGVQILNGACGAIRPGRLTFLLGPSGAGKTTLLKILAGRKRLGVTGQIFGAGREAVLVDQQAALLDTLTAGETLKFAASLKLPRESKRDRYLAIEKVATQLGIYDVLETKTASLSGGERKRLTIACELLTDPSILLLDEPTSGLDSVSSLSVARALRTLASGGRTVACVLHQPSSKLFAAADDIILLASGRTIHVGPILDLPVILGRAGFVCPQYYNMADFLLELANGEHEGNLPLLESEAINYANELKKTVQSDTADKINKKELSSENEALLDSRSTLKSEYTASTCKQLRALLWRCSRGVLRDVYLTQVRLVCHLLVALLLGALYNGAGSNASRYFSNTGCLFFFLLFLYFSNAMPTIQIFPFEAEVVLQEHLNKWYSITAYCVSKLLIDLPIQVLCATVFIGPAWYMTSQPLEFYRFGYAWLICILVVILAQTFGLAIGAACDVKLGLFVIPASNIPMLMFSEFFIPYNEMPIYLRPFALISYFRYAFDAMLQVTYGFDRERLYCDKEFCMFRWPIDYLKHLGIHGNLTLDIAVIIVWIVLLQICLICILMFRVRKACK